MRGKNKNGRDNTKRAKKRYSHFGLKQKKKLLMEVQLMEGCFSYKDNDNSANSNNRDRIIAHVRIKSKSHKSMFRYV